MPFCNIVLAEYPLGHQYFFIYKFVARILMLPTCTGLSWKERRKKDMYEKKGDKYRKVSGRISRTVFLATAGA